MNSSIKVYFFFLGILVFSILFILNPPEGGKKQERSQEEVAPLEVNDFVLLSVENNKPEARVVGKRGMQFEDREEFWDFSLTNYNPEIGGLKSLKTKNNEEIFYAFHGIRRNNSYFFDGGVTYSNADGMSFEAQKGFFLLKQKIFRTQGEFVLKTKEGEFSGIDLYYNGNTQQLEANRPQGTIWLEK